MSHNISSVYLTGLLITGLVWLASCASIETPIDKHTQQKGDIYHPALGSVYLVEDPDATKVDAWLIYPQGEADNPLDEGLAHYLEHLVWYNSLNESGNFRHSNAWTGHFSTTYFTQSPVQELGNGLKKLFATATPIKLDQTFMEQERDIVLREYDQSISEDVYAPLFDEIRRTLFKGSGLSRSVIGSKQGIARFQPERAKTLHRQSHRLGNATLLVYGNLSRDELQAVLQDSVLNGSLQQTPLAVSEPKTGSSVIPIVLPNKALLSDSEQTFPNLPAPLFAFQQLVPLGGCSNAVSCDAAISIINDLLTSSLPGGLAAPLRFDEFIASSYDAGLERVAESHLLLAFDAEPDVGVSLKELQLAFEREWQKIVIEGIREDTFERIKKRYLKDFEKKPIKPENRLSFLLQQLGDRQSVYTLEDYQLALKGMDKKTVDAVLASFQNLSHQESLSPSIPRGRVVRRRFEKGL